MPACRAGLIHRASEVRLSFRSDIAVMNAAYRDSEARAIHFGPMLTLGAYAWNARGWGLNVEVDYVSNGTGLARRTCFSGATSHCE